MAFLAFLCEQSPGAIRTAGALPVQYVFLKVNATSAINIQMIA